MTPWLRLVLGAFALASLGWLAWTPVREMYFVKRASLEERIERCRGDITTCEKGLSDEPRVASAIEDHVRHTLGGDKETVDHRLRTRLNRIGEELGLSTLTVGTGKTRAVASPARSTFTGRAQKSLRDEIDFVEVEAWIAGRGTLEEVLRLVHRVRSEPWLKRIHQVRLDPKDAGKVFDVNLRLYTVFLPGRAPQEIAESDGDPAGFALWQSILARDPFRIPAAPPPEAALVPKQATPSFPYQHWTVTGVAAGPAGPEVWLLNAQKKTSMQLALGATIGKLVLVAASGETAEFRLGERTVTLRVGERLRAPADSSP